MTPLKLIQLASRTPWDSYNRCWSACVSNYRSARCCAKIYLLEFFFSGAGVAVANIPHSDCTVFTPVTGRQPSLIALGERFKALGSVYQLCVVFGNRQNKAVLAVLLTTSSYSAGCPIGPSASRCCAYRGSSKAVEWTCPIGEVIPGWPEQSILLNVAAPSRSSRQMESMSHDPFARPIRRGRCASSSASLPAAEPT